MRQTHTILQCLLLLSAMATHAFGQPSEGPYGPLPRNYPLPKTGNLFFVAPNGDPEAAGRSMEAPTTLEKAVSEATTGDAVILRGGLYRTGGIRFNQGITLQPHANEQPVLTGTKPADDWKSLGDGRWQTPWKWLFPAAPADWWRAGVHLETTPLHRFHYDMVFADDTRLTSAGSLEEVTEDSYYIDYENGTVTIGVDPAEHAVEITAYDSALVRTIRDVRGRRNDRVGPTIRGLTFTRYARLALLIEGVEPHQPMDPAEFGNEVVGSTLEHLTISHCSRVAGYFRGNRFTMRHCLVSDCGTEGIYVINSADVLLERNIVTRTNSHAPIMGYYASAVKIFNQSHRVTCRQNLIIDNPNASGIWYDVGNRDAIVTGNWVERTQNGFFMEISEGAICAGNTFVECSPGVRILNAADVAVYQNTFFNSALYLVRTMRSSEAGDHFGWHASAGPAVAQRDRHVVCNNLFIADANMKSSLLRILEQPEVKAIAEAGQLDRLDGNVYVRQSVKTTPLLVQGETGYSSPTSIYQLCESLDELREIHPAFEKHGHDFPDHAGPVVRSVELKRFELLPSFPGSAGGVEIPDTIPTILKRKAGDHHPGAWPLWVPEGD